MLRLPSLTCVALVAFCGLVSAREFTVLTYNVENLFDADGAAAFEDYKETGQPNSYSRRHVLEKIRSIGKVLQGVGNGTGPDVVLFNEIEIDFTPDSIAGDLGKFLEKNRATTLERMLGDRFDASVRGLPSEALLLKHLEDIGLRGYQVAVGSDAADLGALEESRDGRGVKAQKNAVFSRFPITAVRSHSTPNARDILECTLDVDGKPFTVFVNHWKSGASDPESEVSRRENAKTLRSRLDEIFAADPAADVLVAGDFNSNHNQSVCFPDLVPSGLNDVLGSRGDEAATASARGFSLYNLWYEVPSGERGSDHHRGYWGTLMQKIITPGLYDRNGIQYVDNSFERLVLPGVNAATPLELPRRWTNAGKSGGGASDHFPVLARFRTVEEGDREARIEPADPGSDAGDSAERLKVPYESVRKGDVPVFGSAEARDLGSHGGEIFFVRGKLVSEEPPVVEAGGGKFEVFAHEEGLREMLDDWERGDSVEFLGQLGLQRGREQFVVFHSDWILDD